MQRAQWCDAGPRQMPPPLRDFEANMLGEGSYSISIIHRPCNWMQPKARGPDQGVSWRAVPLLFRDLAPTLRLVCEN
jgi:hypothetical protein